MIQPPTFHGDQKRGPWLAFVDDAGHFALDDRKGFLAYLARTFLGQEVVLTVQPRSQLRSLRANAYYWSRAIATVRY